MLDALCLDGLRQDAAHHEGSESCAVAHSRCYDHHQEAQSHTHHHQCFGIDVFACPTQDDGHQPHTHYEPENEEEAQLEYAAHYLIAIHTMTDGHSAQYDHQQNAQNILEDKH